ncbi:Sua5/YciO/YrdC/YwlC family protein [Zavarzinia sp.]|uniref:Kae1-like domain-containing protein n=1 Tax=Zavarzinia sp. TaxID=2027920 RepID=UPI00356707DB
MTALAGGRRAEAERPLPAAEGPAVLADRVACAACAAEVIDPFARRYRYPFANCAQCGPGFSARAAFPPCAECRREYEDPADRHFRAAAVACHACGPRARLIRLDGRAVHFEQHSMLDDVDAVCGLIKKGEIVAIKGPCGYHLACDATRADVVAALRERLRDARPFALMARDIAVIRRFAEVGAVEEEALRSPAGPVVLLRAAGPGRLAEAVAPGLDLLGFMLPPAPLHQLILRRMDRPVVMADSAPGGGPPVGDEAGLHARLATVATYALAHDRAIATPLADSLVRVIGGVPRVLRRGRGHAPAALALPAGLAGGPPVLALGSALQPAACRTQDGEAILSPTTEDGRSTHGGLLLDHAPRVIAVERGADRRGRALAAETGALLVEVQGHHAAVAACLAESGRPLSAPPVLGIAAGDIGPGDDGGLWGGEFLLADYRSYRRLGTFKPVALAGGFDAAREPWRDLHAHLMAEIGWPALAMNFAGLPLYDVLAAKPRAALDAAIRDGRLPLASSCGRLFDAVAAALGLCPEGQAYEGQAAALLEALVDREALAEEGEELAYPFAIPRLGGGLPYVEPWAMWQALLGDLVLQTPPGVIAARFHRGLARTMVAMALQLRGEAEAPLFDTVVLAGDCFRNAVLFEVVNRGLGEAGFAVLGPGGDGGLALGQAAVALAAVKAGEWSCA